MQNSAERQQNHGGESNQGSVWMTSVGYLASSMKLDFKAVFLYPLEPHPMCIAHIDGRKHFTDKSKLAKELIAKISTEPPKDISAYIVGAMYMIRSLDIKNLPSPYGGLANLILKKICRPPVIHFVL